MGLIREKDGFRVNTVTEGGAAAKAGILPMVRILLMLALFILFKPSLIIKGVSYNYYHYLSLIEFIGRGGGIPGIESRVPNW